MIRKLLSLLVAVVVLPLSGWSADGIDIPAATTAIQKGATVLDVRTAEEFSSGHLSGAINIPHDQLATRLSELRVTPGTPIVVYCRTGRRSEIARGILEKEGYTAVINGGGYEKLSSAVTP